MDGVLLGALRRLTDEGADKEPKRAKLEMSS